MFFFVIFRKNNCFWGTVCLSKTGEVFLGRQVSVEASRNGKDLEMMPPKNLIWAVTCQQKWQFADMIRT